MTRDDWLLLLLLLPLAVAAVTDVRSRRIPNRLTYPGLLLGAALRTGLAVRDGLEWWDGMAEAALGALALGGLMTVCFVFFGLGGGDVKLLAMIGAWLGVERGIEALLWTFVLGAVAAVAAVVWQIGAAKLVVGTWRHLRAMATARGWVPLSTADRAPLRQELYLAPAALAAVGTLVWRRFG